MNEEGITKYIEKAGLSDIYSEFFKLAIKSGREAEREACAKIVDGWPNEVPGLADAIRARGEKCL
jgi:hypothetical protein